MCYFSIFKINKNDDADKPSILLTSFAKEERYPIQNNQPKTESQNKKPNAIPS